MLKLNRPPAARHSVCAVWPAHYFLTLAWKAALPGPVPVRFRFLANVAAGPLFMRPVTLDQHPALGMDRGAAQGTRGPLAGASGFYQVAVVIVRV
jgi:hypothetical protein